MLETVAAPERKMGRPRSVSEETRQQMADAYLSGQSTIQIAAEFGSTSSFVSDVLKEKSIQARKLDKLTQEQREEAARRYREGEETSVLAKEFGACPSAILAGIAKTGTRLRNHSEAHQKRIAPAKFFNSSDIVQVGKVKRLSPVGVTKACLLYLAGHGTGSISRHLGVHKNAVQSLIKLRDLKPRQGEISPQIALEAIAYISCIEDAKKAAQTFAIPLEIERKHILSTAQQLEICQRYRAGEGCVILARAFGTCEAPILAALRRNGIEPRNGKLNEGQLGEIVTRYQKGERLLALGKEYGLGHKNIRALMQKRGIARKPLGESSRIYTCNHNYFTDIETQEQAYWMGFLAADGYVMPKGGISIELAEKDMEVLYRFREAIQSNHKIKYCWRKRHTRETGSYLMSVSSPQMALDLAPWGIVPAKTFKCPWPKQMPHHLLRHYLRGYFDGDGCWTMVTSNKKAPQNQFGIIGPERFLEEARAFLMETCEVRQNKLSRTSCSGLLSLGYGGNLQAARIAHLMYHEATIYLPRKLDKVRSILLPETRVLELPPIEALSST